MGGGVQVRGEWLGGRPFDGTTTTGGYADVIVHRPVMGPVTALLRAERLAYTAPEPHALYSHRYSAGARIRLWRTIAASVGLVHQAGSSRSGADGIRLRPDGIPEENSSAALRALGFSTTGLAPPTRGARGAAARPARGRCALAAVLIFTIGLVSRESRTRAVGELEAARTAFYSLLESRAAAAQTLTALVTELPVFRAHLTDSRLAADLATVELMADGYRQQLAATFGKNRSDDVGWHAGLACWRIETAPLMDASSPRRSGTRTRVSTGATRYLVVAAPAPLRGRGARRSGRLRAHGLLAQELARLRSARCCCWRSRIVATSLRERAIPTRCPCSAATRGQCDAELAHRRSACRRHVLVA
jgi:hypothetical protein